MHYLQSSEGVGLFLGAVYLLGQDGPLGLLIELGNTEVIHLYTDGEGEEREGGEEREEERGRGGGEGKVYTSQNFSSFVCWKFPDTELCLVNIYNTSIGGVLIPPSLSIVH